MKTLGFKLFAFLLVYGMYAWMRNFVPDFYVLEPYFTISLAVMFLAWMILGTIECQYHCACKEHTTTQK